MNINELKWQVIREIRNPKIYLDDVIKYVENNVEDAFNICCRKNLSINEKYPDSRYILQLAQKTVFLTVRMFDLWESAIVEVLTVILSKKFKDIKVNAANDPMGDIAIIFPNKEEMRWEIKSSQAPNYFTGATHSASKCNNYILINYELNKNLKLKQNKHNKNFITKMAVIIWENMETKWLGEPSKNSSFTQLKIPVNIVRERPEIMVVGKFIPKVKWCWIEREDLINKEAQQSIKIQ